MDGHPRALVVGCVGQGRPAEEAVAATLSGAGFAVEAAADGAAALARLAAAPAAAFALVVGNFSLPDMSGVELVSRLRRLPAGRGAAVLLLQSEERPPDEDRDLALAHAAGADACLLYPTEPEELVATARWAVGRRAAASSPAPAPAPLPPPAPGGRTAANGLLLLLSPALVLLLVLSTPYLLFRGFVLAEHVVTGPPRLESAVRSVSPDGKFRVEVDTDGGARLVRVATGHVLHRRRIPAEVYRAVDAHWQQHGQGVDLRCWLRYPLLANGRTLTWDRDSGVLSDPASGEAVAPE